jgi:hypothetical protein
MISSRHDRKTKAIVEALAMIAHAHPELAPYQPRPVRETDEELWESAIEFCAALDRYAGRAMEIKRENRHPPSAPMPGAPRRQSYGSVLAFLVKRVASLP